MNEIREAIHGKTVLVTGGSGTFGQVLVRRLLHYEPRVVRVFSRDESKHWEMQHQLRNHANVRYLVGDIRDKERLLTAMENVDLVYHAAGLKHVVSCEYNAFEAVKTNVLGTQNVIDTALARNVEKVIFTSTDKATNPCNTMGTSKLMAEKLITAANGYLGSKRTILSTVRFGNVLGSRGSVVPRFLSQLDEDGTITLTDAAMTRYVMIDKDAAELVLKATLMAQGGEIFILKMPAVKLDDLASVISGVWATERGIDPSKIQIRSIGAQPGEKLYEELLTPEELGRAVETDDMFILMPSIRCFTRARFEYPGAMAPVEGAVNSIECSLMARNEIESMLIRTGIFSTTEEAPCAAS